jgi:hypothetical protein
MIRMLEMSSDSIGKGFNVVEVSHVGEWALRVGLMDQNERERFASPRQSIVT